MPSLYGSESLIGHKSRVRFKYIAKSAKMRKYSAPLTKAVSYLRENCKPSTLIGYVKDQYYCEGGFHDEPRFSFLKFNRLVDSLQNFEYEYNYKQRC